MPGGVGIPTVKGLTGGLTDYAIGIAGGVGFNLVQNILPIGGLAGGALAAAVIGATVKGSRGETLSTILGFQAGLAGLGNLGIGGGGGGGGDGGDGFELV